MILDHSDFAIFDVGADCGPLDIEGCDAL